MDFENAIVIAEGYNFTNDDEVYEALEANQIGVKLLPEYKDKTKWGYACEKLRIFFKKCNELGIKDTTYGVQLLLSKVPPTNLENIIRTDGLYELLKSRKKPWVKELKEFQTLMNEKEWLGATVNDLHTFEKVVQEGQSKHGKASKGGGDIAGVKTVYDDGTWKLMIPSSFQGAKAASFYIKDGQEIPTEWCTRCDEYYYKRYSKQAPLYIIRNIKTGKSYQMAFTWDTSWDTDKEIVIVHFLDQKDKKGDKITQGDLSKIPNELLKHILIPAGKSKGKTMADYNTAKNESDPDAKRPGYINADKETWSKEQIVDKKYQRRIAKELDEHAVERGDRNPNYTERFSDRDIVRVTSIHGSFKGDKKEDALTNYVENGIKVESKYFPKARKVRYYFLGNPDEYVELVASKKAGIKPSVNEATAMGYTRTILQYVGFYEMGYSIPTKDFAKLSNPTSERAKAQPERTVYASKSAIRAANQKYDESAKKEKVFNAQMKEYAVGKLKAAFPQYEFQNMEIGSFRYRARTKRAKELDRRINGMGGFYGGDSHAPGTNWCIRVYKNKDDFIGTLYTQFKKVPLRKEDMECWFDLQESTEVPQKMKDICFDVAQHIFNTWRKQFKGEIVQNRAEGNYKKNMYESVNIVNRFRKLIEG